MRKGADLDAVGPRVLSEREDRALGWLHLPPNGTLITCQLASRNRLYGLVWRNLVTYRSKIRTNEARELRRVELLCTVP